MIICIFAGMHPRHWTAFGNHGSLPNQNWMPDYINFVADTMREKGEDVSLIPDNLQDHVDLLIWDKVPLGKKKSLHSNSSCVVDVLC